MRQLKFRAWDSKNKKFAFTGFHLIGETTIFDALAQYQLEHLIELEVTQFTGLLDKNSVEIYEGDLVKCPNTLNKHVYGEYSIRCVKWKPDSFTWVLDGDWAWMTFSGAFGEEGDFIKYNDDKVEVLVEVVGNIYQNPELLNAPGDPR